MLTAADTRPCSPASVWFWVRVSTTTTIHGSPKPRSAIPASTAGSHGIMRITAATAVLTMPTAMRPRSPIRASSAGAVRPASSDAAPNTLTSTPR